MTEGMLFLLLLYFVPTMVAYGRRTTTRRIVTVLNLFLGWTVIGWVVAVAMAFGPTEDDTAKVLAELEDRMEQRREERLRKVG